MRRVGCFGQRQKTGSFPLSLSTKPYSWVFRLPSQRISFGSLVCSGKQRGEKLLLWIKFRQENGPKRIDVIFTKCMKN